jgi:hypothetical protein
LNGIPLILAGRNLLALPASFQGALLEPTLRHDAQSIAGAL